MPVPNGGSGRSWEDAYREGWTWDKVVKVTHIRANCVSTKRAALFVAARLLLA